MSQFIALLLEAIFSPEANAAIDAFGGGRDKSESDPDFFSGLILWLAQLLEGLVYYPAMLVVILGIPILGAHVVIGGLGMALWLFASLIRYLYYGLPPVMPNPIFN